MTAVQLLARASGSTGVATPTYVVHVQAGRHHLTADEPATRGGGERGATPLELLLAALVACTATTLRMYAARKGWEPAFIDVKATFHGAHDGRNQIDRTITVPTDLTAEQRSRLADIAERTPVTIAVHHGTPIATTFETRAPTSTDTRSPQP